MPTPENLDLVQRIAQADSLEAPPRMPPAPLGVRLKTSPLIRRMLPTSWVVSRAEGGARQLWEISEWQRQNATEAMASIVGPDVGGDQLEALARAHLVELEATKALFWQPWRVPSIDADDRERLRAALDGPQPVLLSACHQGPYFSTSKVVVTMGYQPYVVAGEWYFADPSHDYWGRRLARWRRGARVHLVRSRGSYRVLSALLERGECVLLYYDMPGPRDSTFLGKPAQLADGTARLAVETGAVVLPLRMVRRGHHTHMQLGAAIDARELDDIALVHSALGEFHERWILEFPPRMDDPRNFGWQDGAGVSAWRSSVPERRARRA